MKRTVLLAVLIASLPAAAWADCTYPKPPGRMPNGNRATKEEMLAAKKLVNDFQANLKVFLTCIEEEKNVAIAKLDPVTDAKKIEQTTARWEQKNDAAVDEEREVADRFNEQIRAFNARTAK